MLQQVWEAGIRPSLGGRDKASGRACSDLRLELLERELRLQRRPESLPASPVRVLGPDLKQYVFGEERQMSVEKVKSKWKRSERENAPHRVWRNAAPN